MRKKLFFSVAMLFLGIFTSTATVYAESQPADVSALRTLMTELSERDANENDNFNIEGFATISKKFTSAYEKATEYLERADSGELYDNEQDDINTTTTQLTEAYDCYKNNQEGMKALQDAFTEATEKKDIEKNYTKKSEDNYDKALNDVINYFGKYYRDENSDLGVDNIRGDLENLANNIKEAMENLVEGVEMIELNWVLFETSYIEKDDYTEESIEKLLEAVDEGLAIKDEDLELSDTNQARVDNAVKKIENALDALVLKSEEESVEEPEEDLKVPNTGFLSGILENNSLSSNLIFAVLASFIVASFSAYKLIFKRK